MIQYIKEGLEGRPVSWYSDVYELVFRDLDTAKAENMWAKQLAEPAKEKGSKEATSSD